MNVQKCLNAHFFDMDKYATCPHCGAPAMQVTPVNVAPPAPQKPAKKGGLFKHKDKKVGVAQYQPQGQYVPQGQFQPVYQGQYVPQGQFQPQGQPQNERSDKYKPNFVQEKSTPDNKVENTPKLDIDDGKTTAINVAEMDPAVAKQMYPHYTEAHYNEQDDLMAQLRPEVEEAAPEVNKAPEMPVKEEVPESAPSAPENFAKEEPAAFEPVEEPVEEPAFEPAEEIPAKFEPAEEIPAAFEPDENIPASFEPEMPKEVPPAYSQMVTQLNGDDEGKTIGFFSIPVPKPVSNESSADESTNSVTTEASASEVNPAEAVGGPVNPCVGWLVCVKGTNFGRNYLIYAGRNSIGRSADNAISVSGDGKISREKHAWIIYDPKKRAFYVTAGEGSGLTYVNGEMVMQPRQLESKDLIEMGDTSFVFAPLCDEKFSWEDYM